ncbi:MAG: Crp/Fnr family transcriptional regulator [Bacteroidota bacterium]
MLKQFIESYQTFSEEEVEQLIPLFEHRTLNKYDFLIKEGEVCDELSIIESGYFHSFYYSEEMEEVTFCVNFPKNLSFAYSSFITGEKSKESIQAITPARVWVLKKSIIDQLSQDHIGWTRFFQLIAERQYIELEERVFQFQKFDAQQRYINLMEQYPECVQQIPLKYLASYLGVTQRHLSRIRKQLTY